MSNNAIVAEGLGKKYTIGHVVNGDSTFRELLARRTSTLLRQTRSFLSGRPLIQGDSLEEVWALKDITFNVKRGDVVGIIGKNGAGKSTLLKILSRVVEPSVGRARIEGRVASLLEVGTGFHPELTGRENIFLNGAILGMSRVDIRKRFDAIVAFAEIERYLDTPVKRYSSGMYVRLAFAVAAHLEPEILIIDEVLAVGDAQFQKKCLGKMNEVATEEGRTVIFVSHQMSMVTSLCQSAILLNGGKVQFVGRTGEAVAKYYSAGINSPHSVDFTAGIKPVGDKQASLLSAAIETEDGRVTGEVDISQPFRVRMVYELHTAPKEPPYPNFHFFDSQGRCAFVSSQLHQVGVGAGRYEAVCHIPANLLNSDTYFIDIALTFPPNLHLSFHERSALSVVMMENIDKTLYESPRSGYSGAFPGTVRPRLEWEIARAP